MAFFDRLKRAWATSGEDNISILAAGVAYYAFLAMVPLLAAIVLGYGLFADPQMVADHIEALAARLPQSAAELIGSQLRSVVETSGTAKGFGLLLALGLAIIGARNGAGAVVTAISLAFNEHEQRGFLRANALALAITLGGIVGLGVVAAALTVTAALTDLLPGLSGGAEILGKVVTYIVLAGLGALGAAWLYRRAPKSVSPGFREVLPGALVASIGLVILTLAFGYYVANFGNYNATYGSLGAVVVLLTWLYLSAYVVLFGSEVAAVAVHDRTGLDS
ncbi:YihY/virulence factor BrkB family protein [Aurantiacibacter poecillastricola]|uniref:YihY/virulence factor BrkB family protein n=1 Tax=Aurantiacibacter poecillastricola TaxID=3064385 RepID=UPI00273DBC20|nr:YihY/virulence factor BrkB family protein [Aurantiacibacter sp. 219JJ12-13]MDP5260488.1 YihY/virulence factor BrkB family protein [Aurantiacibacter sp. 219JJ12-13]